MHCLFCDDPLSPRLARPAFDPWLGRLWHICPSCHRWNPVPLEARWSALERLEAAARDGRVRLRTEHLDLVEAGEGQMVRVGRAPRPELAVWRYGDLVPRPRPRGLGGWLRRLLEGLPSSPFGYSGGYGEMLGGRTLQQRWLASPFVDQAATLTAAFLTVPLAPECPSCGDPLWITPWSFQGVRLVLDGGAATTVAACGLCGAEVGIAMGAARPALRLGLSVVNRQLRERALVEGAAGELDTAGSPSALLFGLGSAAEAIGEMDSEQRLALGIALDEQVEAELLEREWQQAEELAALVDGTLTEVPGFDEFRDRVLGR